MKNYRRIGATLLIAFIMFQQVIISYGAEEVLLVETELDVTSDEETEVEKVLLTISTVEEFLIFAQNCTLDDYSRNIEVVLTADIDLSDTEFYDIPIFLGYFDGAGYTISGLSEDLSKDYQGLFRSVEEGATITNLNVEYNRSTEQSYIGGIVGYNEGTIINCSFTGIINGASYVGGIAAVNTGMIINCTTEGGFFGESQIGGIVGSNEGTILRCYNYADVNTDISGIDFTMEDTINESFLANLGVDTDATNILDIGGITGNNTGIIQNCVNYADVGYPQVGYNIGGIVGIQSGYITGCENYGNVYGRKEVGGIAGQFEPYISTTYSISKLESLQEELDVLSSLTSEFTSNAQGSSDLVSSSIVNLNNSIETSKYYAEALVDQTEDVMNANLETIESVSVTVAEAIDEILVIIESLEDVPEEIEIVLANGKDMVSEIEDIIILLEGYDEEQEEISAYVNASNESLQEALSAFEEAMKIYEFSIEASDSSLEVLTDVSEGATYLGEGLGALNTAIENLSKAIEILEEIYEEAEEPLETSIDNILTDMKRAIESIETINEKMNEALELVDDLIKDLSNAEELTFTTFDEDYDETKELLSKSLGDITDNIESVNVAINTSVNSVLTDFEAINIQLNVVLGLMVEIIADVANYTDSDSFVLEDASYEDIDEITAGKISECMNYGVVEGDINIGGIAGAISFEYSFDMEDDYKLSSDATQTSSNVGIAVIQSCSNYGDVTSNKDCVGGIVGLQEFGLITNTISQADISSIDGNYVGGIVGSSSSTIEGSYSKCNLSGIQFVGGIVGSGASVVDCYSISTVESEKGNIGGIAGDLLSNGTLENNYFVSDTLGGLNGISYSGKAESLEYSVLIEIEDIPDIFKIFTVDFYIEGEIVATKTVDYGEDIVESDILEISNIEGYYGVWETFTWENITSDMRINAEYYTMVTTLASEEKENGLPIVLVEGIYTDAEVLEVKIEALSELEIEQDVIAWYSLSVDGEQNEIEKIRCLAETSVEVQVLVEEQWVTINSVVDGKYVTFVVEESMGNEIEIRLIEYSSNRVWIICSVMGISIVIFLFVFIRKKKSINKSNA